MSECKREFVVGVHIILVDEEDYPFLARFNWHVKPDKKTFYAMTNIFFGGRKTAIAMHRLLTGIRNVQVDHRNRNGLDNRKENLRYCTAQQNSFNRQRKNKYGFRGVYLPNRSSKYSYQIQVNGKRECKHGFNTAEDAARAYDERSKELHGEFGIRNFKD